METTATFADELRMLTQHAIAYKPKKEAERLAAAIAASVDTIREQCSSRAADGYSYLEIHVGPRGHFNDFSNMITTHAFDLEGVKALVNILERDNGLACSVREVRMSQCDCFVRKLRISWA